MDYRRVTLLPGGCMLLLLLVAIPVNSETPSCRVQDCPNFRVIRHYEELGCRRSDNSDECCPTRYNCSALLSLDKSKCHYRGKVYYPGAEIHQEIKSVCTPSCSCSEIREGVAEFNCGHYDCREFFQFPTLAPGCYMTYSAHQCCSTGVRCANSTESHNEIAECIYNGKRYLEGQYMEGSDSDCFSCACQAGFNGTLDGPWCRKVSCDYTLRRSPSALASCAPIYWRNQKCCPILWHCPSPGDAVVRRSGLPSRNDEQCSFGEHRLKIGDELRTNNPCVKCQCDIPPFITCTQVPETECVTQTNGEELVN